MPVAGRAVEGARRHQDSALCQTIHGLPGVLVAAGPQVQPGLRVVDLEAVVPQRLLQHEPAPGITLTLRGKCFVVGQRDGHRLLDRPRHDHPGLLSHRQQGGHQPGVTGYETGPVAGQVGRFRQ